MPSTPRQQRSVAVFLDIDKVITYASVQRSIALAYEELKDSGTTGNSLHDSIKALEEKYQSAELSSMQLGELISRAFNEAGITKQKIESLRHKVAIRPQTTDVLNRGIDIYIVTAAPSYYVRPFAETYGIPLENVHCSLYQFNQDGKDLRCTVPVTKESRRNFVREHAAKYLVSIGIGNSDMHDGPMLRECGIRILAQTDEQSTDATHTENQSLLNGPYLHDRPNLEGVNSLLRNLSVSPSEIVKSTPARDISILVLSVFLLILALWMPTVRDLYFEQFKSDSVTAAPLFVATLVLTFLVPACGFAGYASGALTRFTRQATARSSWKSASLAGIMGAATQLPTVLASPEPSLASIVTTYAFAIASGIAYEELISRTRSEASPTIRFSSKTPPSSD